MSVLKYIHFIPHMDFLLFICVQVASGQLWEERQSTAHPPGWRINWTLTHPDCLPAPTKLDASLWVFEQHSFTKSIVILIVTDQNWTNQLINY